MEKKSIGNEDIQEAFMQWECCEDDEDCDKLNNKFVVFRVMVF